MRLLLPFVVLPIIEIALFIQVGGLIGVLPTIGLVILSSVLGVSVMRRQGMLAAMDVQRAMQEFRDPARPMAEGALTMIAGLLLLVPGLFTSALGLLLLVPPLRDLLLRWLGRKAGAAGLRYDYRAGAGVDFGDLPPGHRRGGGWQAEEVIDGEYSVQDDPPGPVRQGLTDQSAPGQGPGRRGGSGWTRH